MESTDTVANYGAPPVPEPPVAAAGRQSPLSPQQIQQIIQAGVRGRKINRARVIATLNGWIIAICAVITGLCCLQSPLMLGLAGCLGLVAFFELRGAAGLKKLDLRAPRLLAYNQVALGCLLAVYAIWQIILAQMGQGALAQVTKMDPQIASLDPELAQELGAMDRMIPLLVYGALLAYALIGQGALTLYHLSRGRLLRAFVTQTPPWIVDLQHAGVHVF